jgi:hypothetical protein
MGMGVEVWMMGVRVGEIRDESTVNNYNVLEKLVKGNPVRLKSKELC